MFSIYFFPSVTDWSVFLFIYEQKKRVLLTKSWKTCSTCACLTDLIYNVIRQRAIEWRVKESYRMANKNKPTITGNRCDQYAPLRTFHDNYLAICIFFLFFFCGILRIVYLFVNTIYKIFSNKCRRLGKL